MRENARLIHEAMVARGFTRDRSVTKAIAFSGSLRPNGTEVAVEILFPDATLSRLPKLRLLDRGKQFADVVAHIEDNDRVCFAQEIEMQLDPHAVEASVVRCLAAMTGTLARMLTTDLSAEVAEEFPQHWRGDAHVYVAEAWPKTGNAKLMRLKRDHDAIMILGRDGASLTRFGATAEQKKSGEKEGLPIRVIRTKNRLTFKKPFIQPATLAELLQWAASVEHGLDRQISGALADQPIGSLRVFLAAENGVVGAIATPPPHLLQAQQRNSFIPYLIAHHADKIPISRITGERADEGFVIGRNPAGRPSLAGKRIAIIGLGTIGGHLSKLIAQAGAGMGEGMLLLLDQQTFSPGNVGRHILGLAAVGLEKAGACSDLLRVTYPGINVRPIVGDALAYLDELGRCDLILDATGDHPTSISVNQYFVELAKSGKSTPSRLHVWLEGNGVAARAMAVDAGSACLDCLIQTDGKERFPVLRPDHPAAVTPADCGEGAYFAYGPGASPIAAGLAVQMALESAVGTITPHLRTIRIVEAATFQTKDQNPTKLAGCRACA